MFNTKLIPSPVLYFSSDIFVSVIDEDLVVQDLKNKKEELSRYRKKGGVRFVYRDKNLIYFRDNASVFENGDIYCLNLATNNVEFVCSSEFSLAVFLGERGGKLFFYMDSGRIFELESNNEKNFNIKKITSIEFPSSLPLILDDKIVVFGLNGQMQHYTFSGELIRDLNVANLYHDKSYTKVNLSSCTRAFKDVAVCQLNTHTLMAVNCKSGDVDWITENAAKNQWDIDEEGTIYSIIDGVFKKHSSQTGDLLAEYPIEFTDSQGEITLFKMALSEKYLWCGFHNKGLCALNKDTGQVVWEDFSGSTCNKEIKVCGNYLNVEFVKGGIGLDGGGKNDLILSGEL